LGEAEFVKRVVDEAECHLLLDINNVYVNAVNFKLDARQYIDTLPLDRVIQFHIAGHDVEIENELLVDTHGAPIVDPVYDLLQYTVTKMRRAPPILLERDHAIPPLPELEAEMARIERTVAGAL
ncbi:MAG TPA: DUF692 family protein, partial [Myxococcota bacterium]